MKRMLCAFVVVLLAAVGAMTQFAGKETKNSYIKYVEFNVTSEALRQATELDINSRDEDTKLDYITLLAYLGAKYGGDFTKYKYADMTEFAEKLKDGESVDKLTKDMKLFEYYKDAYNAALDGMVGEYTEEHSDDSGNTVSEEKYGIRWFSPIAKSFPCSSYDDFGAERTYGYKRPHLGHDIMAAVGTPVIAVESGKVECMGWNQYGGWRIGIRSYDTKRYWYYAHLRQNRPFAEGLHEGDEVEAGDVIGYVGRTGYSATENTNGIETTHLHLGLELVFDESQKDSNNEIWINLYAITNVLESHQSSVVRNSETKEFTRLQ